jgi:regulator of replication initiation timing
MTDDIARCSKCVEVEVLGNTVRKLSEQLATAQEVADHNLDWAHSLQVTVEKLSERLAAASEVLSRAAERKT